MSIASTARSAGTSRRGRGRRREVGATTVLALPLMAALVTAGGASMLYGNARASAERAVTGAQAVAHAVAAQAASLDGQDDALSIDVQSGRYCEGGTEQQHEYPTASDAACKALLHTAQQYATWNHVALQYLIVGPDVRDQGGVVRAGRIAVYAEVRGNGPMADVGPFCAITEPTVAGPGRGEDSRSPHVSLADGMWCRPLGVAAAAEAG